MAEPAGHGEAAGTVTLDQQEMFSASPGLLNFACGLGH